VLRHRDEKTTARYAKVDRKALRPLARPWPGRRCDMISLRQALVDYLRVRRGLGFKLVSDQRLLESFVGFLEQAGAEHITTM
jgi:hypothetical protein